ISNYDGTYQYTYVGTTDTDYQGSIDDPQCTRIDIDYVLKALNAAVTTKITADDVTAVWSGLRPLVKSVSGEKISSRTADLSRRHKVSKSKSGVITIAGGKLTTYRKMAQDTVDEVLAAINQSARCKTKNLKVIGAESNAKKTSDSKLMHLHSRFGSETEKIIAMIKQDPSLGEPLTKGLPYLRAEAIYAVQFEMARTLDDILSRRTRARIINRRASVDSARSVAELIAPLLGWSDQEINNQVLRYCNSCADEDHAALQLQ
ncbi:MAG: glycerol-3-phosphate dehydrogenase C-terminal domain-containing protein, partial [Acidimicrobiaceae bacterium]